MPLVSAALKTLGSRLRGNDD
ncbi:hypothetical protein CT19431_160310 [Cupriavidus taiwanensis]|nr:hypothetical protein CT19431_160310 [Cupriavidus taiwanensis]